MNVSWFSAGVSSFISTYLVKDELDLIIYQDILDHHPDNKRFILDCEKVLGMKVYSMDEILGKKARSVESVCKQVRYINGPAGAPCTKRLKVHPRLEWESKNKGRHTYYWGIDPNESDRTEKIIVHNTHADHRFPLIEHNITKEEAHFMLEKLGIKRPVMYELGYPNNNCIGCVRGGLTYWNRIRVDFPEVFESRAKLEREIGASMLKDKNGRIFLDELHPDRGGQNIEIFPECNVLCQINYAELFD